MVKTEELTNPDSCLNKAAYSEMLFVLLARDGAAPQTIYYWVKERIRLGLNNQEDQQIISALKCADEMRCQYASNRPRA